MPATSQTAPPIFPTGVIYRLTSHTGVVTPEKQDIPGVAKDQHGTYKRLPYYAFVEDEASGEKWLVSDGKLKARLKPVRGSAGMRATSDGTNMRTAKYTLDVQRSEYDASGVLNAVVSVNDEICGNEPCFAVSGTGNFNDLPSSDNQFTIYVQDAAKPDIKAKGALPWGSAFTPKPGTPLSYMYVCWDITKLAYADYQDTGCHKPLLSLPPRDSKNYAIISGDLMLPFGWLYDQVDYGNNNTFSSMMSSGSEVMHALQRTSGFNITGGLVANIPGIVDVETTLSFKQSNGVAQQFQKMYQSKLAFTESQFFQTEYALVVDKINGGLDPSFRAAVASMLPALKKGGLSQETLADFIKEWGTHYAYAVTYGTQGTATYYYTENAAKQLVQKKVDVSTALSAQDKVSVFGIGGTLGMGSESSEARDAFKEFSSIVSASKENYHCSGGASCDGGRPSGTPLVPVFLDLRPISELLAPPYYDDADVVLGLRDAVSEAVLAYGFQKQPATGPAIRIAEIEFGTPKCNDNPCGTTFPGSTWDFGGTFFIVEKGVAISAENATSTPQDIEEGIIKGDYSKGRPSALVLLSDPVEYINVAVVAKASLPFGGVTREAVYQPQMAAQIDTASLAPVTFSASPLNLPGGQGSFGLSVTTTLSPRSLNSLFGIAAP